MTDLTLFNCSLAERQLDKPVPCFSGPGYQVYSVISSYSIEVLPLLSCTKMYNLSSVPYWSYKPANLYLEWSEPNCGQCEAKGKMCRLKNNGTKSEIECVDFSKAVWSKVAALYKKEMGGYR
ncbi:rust resistance kinase Lr10-like [Prunus yedoensis var. nudiflora]|uniref:RING-type E3 ubiquitin transferase n=1 Tax=Prunus yedoensis var. nudiflora TaxID=2094558 RepID=A0A314Y4S0_PRUYE|nr:rust resistance kinase Lr10-like [Prunus yedoensis var. nudiflora]